MVKIEQHVQEKCIIPSVSAEDIVRIYICVCICTVYVYLYI